MRENTSKNADGKTKMSLFSRLGIGKEKDFFIENLAVLLSSGIDVVSAIDSMESEIKSGGMKKVIRNIKSDIEEGKPLSKALENAKIFPEFVFSLISIGEKSGRLPENLLLIINQQKKERTFRSKVNSAVMYPALILSLSLVIGVGISWYILPKLSIVFSQLKIKLPLITKILIAFGNFMGQHGIVVVPSFLFFLFVLFYFLFVFSRTKFIGQKALLFFPGIRILIREVELARMGYVLGILLDAGVPVVKSINALASSSAIYDYKKLYNFIGEKVEEGNSFQKSFSLYKKSSKLITGSVIQIISAGEKSGKLPESLMRVGQIYEEKTENTTKNLATILEPILLVIVWLGVVFVALAVILPIYSLVGGFNTNPQNPQGASSPPPVIEPVSEDVPANKEEYPIVEQAAGDGNDNPEMETVEILQTVTGYLNVRDINSPKGKIIGKVLPGQKFDIQEEKEGWYRIKLPGEKEGWISGDYAK